MPVSSALRPPLSLLLLLLCRTVGQPDGGRARHEERKAKNHQASQASHRNERRARADRGGGEEKEQREERGHRPERRRSGASHRPQGARQDRKIG